MLAIQLGSEQKLSHVSKEEQDQPQLVIGILFHCSASKSTDKNRLGLGYIPNRESVLYGKRERPNSPPKDGLGKFHMQMAGSL